MALLDIGGGQYRDIDTREQLLDVIREKISFEFADEIEKLITLTGEEYEYMREEYEYLDRLTDEWREVFQNVSNLSEEIIRLVEQMPRMDRKKIIGMFKDIRNEAYLYT